ncbi:cell division protein FtsQ/DivIB [Arthrobacter sp. LAPM80]|uniref:cell division protein FtsQ/DivIB n=1 Tax=Arthrobacter sp. LAPM80 TaxID=3141788 RepID=UPI00398A7927
MAEPRKPRVIRTRPGTVPPAAAPDDAQETVPAAVRSTSTKVSVQPVPAAAKPPAEAKRPGMKIPGWLSPKSSVPDAVPARPAPAKPAPGPKAEAGQERNAQVLAFPLPEFKRRRRAILYAVVAVGAVLTLVMVLALFSPALAVKTVVFQGQKLVSEETLHKALAPILDKPLPQVTDEEVKKLLAPIIQVKSSRIEAKPPSTLLIHLVERVPVALLKNGEDYLLVDQDGVQLGSTKDPGSVALPLIDGGTAAIGKDTFRAMTAVLSNLPQTILGQLANATANSPDAVELKLSDGRSVIWGNASDMELKAQVLEALLNAPPPTVAAGKPAPVPANVFDVSAPRHPVTR